MELTFISSSPPCAVTAPALGLVKVLPREDQGREANQLWVTPDIQAVLVGESRLGFPHIRADVLVTNFIAGYRVTVSLKGDPTRRPDMERLAGLDEAWAICFRSPIPGWRLFGRFCARAVFVGVALHDRHELKGRRTYSLKAQEAVAKWESMFPGEPPHRGTDPRDYIEGAAYDLDKPLF